MRIRKRIEGAGAQGAMFQRKGLGGERPSHPPEHNLIQQPGILRDIANFLGLRQPHITPALAENIQAVLVIDDLGRRKTPSSQHRSMAVDTTFVGDGVTRYAAFGVWNPLPSTTRCRLTRISYTGSSVLFRTSFLMSSPATSVLPVGMSQPPVAGVSSVVDRQDVSRLTGPSTPAAIYGNMAIPANSLYPIGRTRSIQDFIMELQEDMDFVCEPGSLLVMRSNSLLGSEGFRSASLEWDEEPIV